METRILTFSVPNGAGADTEASKKCPVTGLLKKIIIQTPNFTNAITVELILRSGTGNSYYLSGEKAENLSGDTAVTILPSAPIPVRSTDDVVIENSADPGAGGGNVVVELSIERV